MRFGLLGPLTVYDGAGGARPLNSAKGQALLAALLLRANRVVPVDVLKEALWGGHAPASANASLYNHVTRLRRTLGADGDGRLRSVAPGYLLRVGAGELDSTEFTAAVRRAREAYARTDWAAVLGEAATASALWRSRPLDGLPAEVSDALDAQPFVQQLEEERLQLLEWRYEAELRLGRHGGLAPELCRLATEHPLREGFHRQLMLVLRRTGRQAEALAVFQALRRRLVEELGVEPGAAVQEALQEVLREDEAVPGVLREDPDPEPAEGDAAEDAVEGVAVGTPVGPATATEPKTAHRPAQLPPPPDPFLGRDEQVAALYEALAPRGGRAATAVLSGMAGVGKSALAVHVAHGLREQYPDGQLFLNLHGANPGVAPMSALQALEVLLRDLGVPSGRVPDEVHAASALLRSTLAGARTLLVLDDAAGAAQVRPLLPAGPGCAVLVTSRSPLAALDGAVHLPLARLAERDSVDLISRVSGHGRVPADSPAARRLAELCGQLPLALRVVAARLAARRALTVEALVELLDGQEGRLDHLEYDDLSVRRSLAVAYDALVASERPADRDAALALRRMGALDLPEYETELAARLMDADTRRTCAALDRLVDVALLEEVAFGRYAPHDLVRDFARELAAQHEDAAEREAAERRGVEWFAARAAQSVRVLLPPSPFQALRLAGEPEEAAAPFADAEAAFCWGDRELAVMSGLVARHVRTEYGRDAAVTLVRMLAPYLQRRGRTQELANLSDLARAGARESGDAGAEVVAMSDLASAYFMSGRYEKALVLIDDAIARSRLLGDDEWLQRVLSNRGLLLYVLGRAEESAAAQEEALAYAHRLGDDHAVAICLSHLGNLYELTDARKAIEYHRRSLEAGVRLDSARLQQTARCNIGCAYLTLGEPEAAVGQFEEALRSLEDSTDWHTVSETRLGLIRALRTLARAERAARECETLLDLAELRGDAYTAGKARYEYGHVLRTLGRAAESDEQWRLSLKALDGTDADVLPELRTLV
ncbi:AfsR/SARP family transcriptional regulator [Streptomyces ochraceiscleroticus]|uniref:BTAD domain-containing putative transcriptional regulator n=1 Tax=Streptomyces ochraceiscleroticus TaxID=47761 RepID=A0ABW1MN01_9ACTN|nr:BTAD domain-containing putative transcriptional regulator [Streptomyces ochraceiscleroticus]